MNFIIIGFCYFITLGQITSTTLYFQQLNQSNVSLGSGTFDDPFTNLQDIPILGGELNLVFLTNFTISSVFDLSIAETVYLE